MKNYLLLFICFIVFLAGCELTPVESGKSAYEIAVENGFIGSEKEWLESLKGDSLNVEELYDVAVKNGYDKDFLTFLKEYFNDTEIKGESAYDIALKNGFTGTEAEWLASLKGDKGDKGETLDLHKIYLELVERDEFDGSYLEFVQQYLDVDVSLSNEVSISKALLSSVIVVASDQPKESWDETTTGSTGAGVIYKIDKSNGNAYIITNYHVVFDSDNSKALLPNIYVYLYGQTLKQYLIDVECIGGSATYDIAVLKVSNSDVLKNSICSSVEVFDSNKLAVGSTAIAVGNPEGDGFSATEGIVSVDSEHIQMRPVNDQYVSLNEDGTISMRVIRIDTPVNPGNSGGGLFNSNGQLIGIVNAKIQATNVENIGYAIPSVIAVNVANNLIYNCDGFNNTFVKKCLMGVTIETTDTTAFYDEETKTVFVKETITVNDVSMGSIAYGKLLAGDVIVKFELNGVTYDVTRNFVIVDACLAARPGDTSVTTIIRNGVVMEIELTFDSIHQVIVG